MQSKIFMTSDTHYFHKNIISYAERPYASLEEMHESMINNWNFVVSENDSVVVIGDFCFGNAAKMREITAKLNGKFNLILGNHDKHTITQYLSAGFLSVDRKSEIIYKDLRIKFSHYPYTYMINPEEPRPYHDRYPEYTGEDFLLHGHCHSFKENKLRIKNVDGNKLISFDVGVDGNDFTPILLDDIIEQIYE